VRHHLEQTKEQQERIRERIKTLGGRELGMEPTHEKGKLLVVLTQIGYISDYPHGLRFAA
jgi:hypothetical protein